MKIILKKHQLFGMLCCLTFLFMLAQASIFIVHFKLSGLFDSVFGSSISYQVIHPVILFPIIKFLLVQLAAYLLLVCWIWFITISAGELFKLSKRVIYYVGLLNWAVHCVFILILNAIYFPASLFSLAINRLAQQANTKNIPPVNLIRLSS